MAGDGKGARVGIPGVRGAKEEIPAPGAGVGGGGGRCLDIRTGR